VVISISLSNRARTSSIRWRQQAQVGRVCRVGVFLMPNASAVLDSVNSASEKWG